VRKTSLLSIFYIELITLPRQAPDKHRESTQQSVPFDRSVPDIAISSFDFQDPYTLMSKDDAMSNRLAYYASVSWMDHQVR
jgi:hypothetical protein